MKRFIEAAAKLVFLLALAIAAPLAFAQDMAPDVLVRTILEDVIAAIKRDQDIQSGDPRKIGALVEATILPQVDFAHMTRIAMGVTWRQATSARQEWLSGEFKTLLVRTYSTALASYRDQSIQVKPLRAGHADGQVTVRSEIRQPGAQVLSIDYEMEKTPAGWKIFDVTISGASLALAYRTSFAEEVRNHGIEGLIELLQKKNRQSGARKDCPCLWAFPSPPRKWQREA